MAGAGVNDASIAEQSPSQRVDVSTGPEFDFSSVLNVGPYGSANGAALQSDSEQGSTPGSNGSGSDHATASNIAAGGGGGSFAPHGLSSGGFGGAPNLHVPSGGTPGTQESPDTPPSANGTGGSGAGGSSPLTTAAADHGLNPDGPAGGPGNGPGPSDNGPGGGGNGGPNGTPSPQNDVTLPNPDVHAGGGGTPDVSPTQNVNQPEQDAGSVPEPGSLVLLAFGLYATGRRRSRARNP